MNAICDKLVHHWDKSIFKGYKNERFWNPEISWKNKWKDGDPKNGEAFPFSSGIMVWVTDAWHLFKSIGLGFQILAIVFYFSIFSYFPEINIYFVYKIIIELAIYHTLGNFAFSLFYDKILVDGK